MGIVAHGEARRSGSSREYRAWGSMKARCFNPKATGYKNYGGRGITVCKRWLHSYANFLADMGRCPAGLTLERKNNDGNYTPKNCKWATRSEQMANRRKMKWRTVMPSYAPRYRRFVQLQALRYTNVASVLSSCALHS